MANTPTATRTFNPLPFEHLEPKRFEDMVRQLAYDFRTWRQLEATGRGGSDDGFDARGFEAISTLDAPQVSNEIGEVDEPESSSDRVWLIQCKREKVITPKKMLAHLDEIPLESRGQLHGMLFVAACDFSKATRDVYRAWCAESGIAECYIWGKAELEDLLYQPKNDHLLFAYFGVSLKIRRQSAVIAIRRVTAVKRKLKRHLDDPILGHMVIIRDASDLRYPDMATSTLEAGEYLWRVKTMHSLGVYGLRIISRSHSAYVDPETGFWDLASKINHGVPVGDANQWLGEEVYPYGDPIHELEREFIERIPRKYRYMLTICEEIPYSEILEIDDVGDDISELATIFVQFRNGAPPCSSKNYVTAIPITGYGSEYIIQRENHRRIFPEELRDIAWESKWGERNNFDLRGNRLNLGDLLSAQA